MASEPPTNTSTSGSSGFPKNPDPSQGGTGAGREPARDPGVGDERPTGPHRFDARGASSSQPGVHAPRAGSNVSGSLAGDVSAMHGAIVDHVHVGSMPEHSGSRIGSYTLLSIIGEGGFGLVWLAERREPMLQRVAIKLIKPGMDSKAVLARFDQERQALAVMDHPNVARVYDGGVTSAAMGSRPYFVMEHVAGEAITSFADREGLTLQERLELFVPVCEAVQHAHHKGVIHRDLKPSNILVSGAGRAAGTGEVLGGAIPKVIDFGVAKAMSRPLTDKTLFTEAGQMIGTPEYMSPEQVGLGGQTGDIDTRTDVYALGVVLYELLVGALPMDSARLRSMSLADMQQAIRSSDAPRPSNRLNSLGGLEAPIAERRNLSPQGLRKALKGELEWIPLKAMRKNRDERYTSPAELAADIRNFLARRPLIAGPETTGYRVRKFVRRNRGPVIAITALAGVLIAGIIGTTSGYVRAARRAASEAAQRQVADNQRARAETIRDFIVTTLRSADPDSIDSLSGPSSAKQDILVSQAMERAALRLARGELAANADDRVQLMLVISGILQNAGRGAPAERLAREALDLARREHSGDDPMVAEASLQLASSAADAGKDAEAEPLAKSAVEMRERLLQVIQARTGGALTRDAQAMARDLAFARGSLGTIINRLGRLEEAIEVSARAYRDAGRVLSADDPMLARLRSNVAVSLEAIGRFNEAEPLYARATEATRKQYTSPHPAIAAALSDQAVFYERMGRSKEAEPLLLESLDIWRKVYSGDHPMIARCLNSLGAVYQSAGNPIQAEAQYRDAMAMRTRLYPGDHPEVATSLNNIGTFLIEQGRLEEGSESLRLCLEMRRRLFPAGHPDIALALNNVAGAYAAEGRAAEALPLHEEALLIRRRVYASSDPLRPAAHPDLASSLNNVAYCYNMMGKPELAEEPMREALVMLQSLFPGDSDQIATMTHNIGAIQRNLGKYEKAKANLGAAVAMRRRLFPNGHWQTVMSLTALAMCHQLMGEPSEAQPLFEQARTLGAKVWPEPHPEKAWVEGRYAMFLESVGRRAEALVSAKMAQNWVAEVLPESHPDRIEIDAIVTKLSSVPEPASKPQLDSGK